MITSKDRAIIRELAKHQAEYANLPEMYEKKKLWYLHNSLKSPRPMIVVEESTFAEDLLPPLECETEIGRRMEYQLLMNVVNHRLIKDDKVVPDKFPVTPSISMDEFGVKIINERAEDEKGRKIGFKTIHQIIDVDKDISKLSPAKLRVDHNATKQRVELANDILGDILPVVVENSSIVWFGGITGKMINLMGMEAMFTDMILNPDGYHKLMNFVTDNMINVFKWTEDNDTLTLNNQNHYAGAGSFGFTDELPQDDFEGKVRLKDLWLNFNSQETVGISPEMFGDMVYPYYEKAAKLAGLTYYGCCEPVDSIWQYISKLSNLRKVSISKWCDEEFMGEALAGSKIIYSRKPDPNYIGVGRNLDEEAFAEHIGKTLKAAKGCGVEIIFRDIYTLTGDINKPGRAVEIVRQEIDKIW